MRAAWLLVLLVAAPVAAAQQEPAASPSLTVEPAERIVAPNGMAQAKLVVTNPLARDLILNLTVDASDGAKARLERAEVRVPAGTERSIGLTVIAGDALNETYVIEVVARELLLATRASDAPPLTMSAKMVLLTSASPPVATEARPPPKLELGVLPRAVDIAPNGTAVATLTVRNAGDAPASLALSARAPAWLHASFEAHPDRLAPGSVVRVTLTLTARDGPTEVALHEVALFTAPAPPAGAPPQLVLRVRVIEAPVVDAAAAEVAAPPAAPGVDERVLVAAVVGSVAAGWTALWLTRREWWPLLLALYTRLRPSRILDHPVRRRIAELVMQNPGVTFSELARLAGIAPGQLTHHARMLEKAGVVFSSPDGQTRRFFHVGAGRLAPIPPLAERALQLLRERPRRASELARDLGVSRQALHYHVKHLAAQGKVIARAEGRELWLEIAESNVRTSARAEA